MSGDSAKPTTVPDVSWAMLLVMALVIVGALWMLSYDVLYTEGEVTQALFRTIVCLLAASVAVGFYRRKIALWSVAVAGGTLLLWQAYQLRRWAIIHEDVVAIVQFAESTKSKTSHYPADLEGYTFKTPWVKSHVRKVAGAEGEEFRINYFMNNTGITYWYSSKSGF